MLGRKKSQKGRKDSPTLAPMPGILCLTPSIAEADEEAVVDRDASEIWRSEDKVVVVRFDGGAIEKTIDYNIQITAGLEPEKATPASQKRAIGKSVSAFGRARSWEGASWDERLALAGQTGRLPVDPFLTRTGGGE
jgi:hypothetical protein